MAKDKSKGAGGGGRSSNLTETQKDALDYYKQDGYYINNILRQGLELDDKEKEYVKLLDEVTTSDVKQDTLYRVVDADTIFPGMDDFTFYDMRSHLLFGDNAYDKGAYSQNKKAQMEKLVKTPIGKGLTDDGFMSVTTDYDTALHKTSDETHGTKQVILKLTGTKGAKGADMGFLDKKYDYLTPEHEMLLSRKNGYKYKKVYVQDNAIIIEAEFRKK